MKKILVLMLALIVLLAAGCGTTQEKVSGTEKEKPVLKIGYLPITHSLPLVVADKLNAGKYKNFTLELVKFTSWPELTEALNSGKIDGAMTMLELALASAERGMPGEILTLSHRNGDNITVSKEINSITELKGKNVAIPHRMSGHNILLYQALKDNGMTLEDVEWIEMPPPDMPAALARGDIKGYVVAEPFGAKAILDGYGKELLKAQEIIPNWICCGLVINPQFKNKNSQVVQEFVTSLVEAGNYITKNQAKATAIAQDYMKIDAKVWEKSFEWGISFADLHPKKEEVEKLQNYLLELKLMKKAVNIDSLVDESFVKAAYEKVK